jgi:isoquinoline 1-oxidoreductase subunit beta
MSTQFTQVEDYSSEWLDYDEPVDRVEFNFGVTRRQFVQVLGAGLIIAAWDFSAIAQDDEGPRKGGGGKGGRGRGGGGGTLSARIHIAKDGAITVLTGKVECGQGARAELTQAAAEELRLAVEQLTLVMADTGLCPDDGITAGSGSTPGTVPTIRRAAAAVRELLVDLAAKNWQVDRGEIEVHDGKAIHAATKREQGYADLAASEDSVKELQKTAPAGVTLTPVKEWKVLGTSAPRPNRHEIVTGTLKYPSDVTLPGMLYGKILRPISYGAKLEQIDLEPAKRIEGVVALQDGRDGQFVGVAAPTAFEAEQALAAIAATAKWKTSPHPASSELFSYLKENARLPKNPVAVDPSSPNKWLRQSYQVAYVQHAPMEPRAAVAQWEDGKVTVWTGTQAPPRVRDELKTAFGLTDDKVRVIATDCGGGFGGKHSGECAVEAARLAKAADKPVSLRWTRPEEFTWAYFRPAGVIDIEASIDPNGDIASWFAININSGGQSLSPPYRTGKSPPKTQTVDSKPPLRHGSYRALAATANTFARECFLDELAELAGRDALDFRLAHIEDDKLKTVLEEAAKRFDWANRVKAKEPNIGVGLACGFEKRSYVAACAEVEVDQKKGHITVRHICEVFDCGAVLNPGNLEKQIQGAIIMGLGPALREEMRFEEGKMLNASFSKYQVPRFDDVPTLDVHVINKPWSGPLESAGAGETPIIAIAPAIANAVFRAAGQRVREMPIRLPSE